MLKHADHVEQCNVLVENMALHVLWLARIATGLPAKTVQQ